MNIYAPFDQLFDASSPCFTPELAKRLIELRADSESARRMQELAGLANEGQLSLEQSREYESAVRATSLISLLQAKARLFVKQNSVSR